MIILHGAFCEGFFIWGESSITAARLSGLRRPKRADASGAEAHTWDPGAGKIMETLGALGFHCDRPVNTPKAEVLLPTVAQKYPLPSSPLLGEIPAVRGAKDEQLEPEMRKWSVDKVPLSVPDLARLISALAGDAEITAYGRLVAPGVMMAHDFCYISACYRLSVSLIKRGRFLPDIRQVGGARYESVWRPLLLGNDAECFALLMRGMPPILRSLGSPVPAAAGEFLYGLLSRLVNELVRYAWAQKIRKNMGDAEEPSPGRLAHTLARKGLKTAAAAQVSERRGRGKLVSSLNPHTLWVRSLGWASEAEDWSSALGLIYRDVRDWWWKFEWFALSPYKVCLRLAEKNDRWCLVFLMCHLESGAEIRAADIWSGAGPFPGGAGGAYLRRLFLLCLGRVGCVIPQIRKSLELLAPQCCPLTTEEAAEFLRTQASQLQSRGICIIFPEWWQERAGRKITLRGRVSGEKGEELSFTWELMLNGLPLTEEMANAILNEGVSLFKQEGRWTFVRTEDIASARARLERLPSLMTAREALRVAVSDAFIEGFTGASQLESAHSELVRGIPRAILRVPAQMRGTLRAYQLRGYSWLAMLSHLGLGACLADDMGLGKTVQALALIQYHRDRGERRPVLVVCPTSVLENWRLEISRFLPDAIFYLHHGRNRAQGDEFLGALSGGAIVLSSYSILQREAALYQRVDWAGVVLDEAQNIKNPDTKQARAARGIKAGWRVVLTGTPVENHVGDLWSIMEFLMPGLLGSRRFFANEYVRPIQENRDTEQMENLKRQISPFIMRRMKTDKDIVPDLPKIIETKIFCGLRREQVRLYSDVSDALNRNIAGTSGIKRRGMVLAALTRIKQICDHPSLVTKDTDYDPARSDKMARFIDMAGEMAEVGDRTLVFTQYVEMGHILKSQLQESCGREVLFLHGGVAKDARDKMVRCFQESRGTQFFILSLRAGGVGLNLTNANRVVMYDRWWNPAVEKQAIDRAYRIGQTRNVQVHIFCCRGTLEERIDELISSKKEVASRVIGRNDNWITELSDRELQELLSLAPGALEV